MDSSSLAHCKWECQYHIVFIPKFRRKKLYGMVKDDVRDIIKTLCSYKKVEIIAGAVCADHVHLCVSIPPKLSMRQHGIEPEILGASRVDGFSYTLNKKAKQENGFSDRRSENYRRPPKTGEETVEQRIRQLENELAYTRQEVEFLKKLQLIAIGPGVDSAMTVTSIISSCVIHRFCSTQECSINAIMAYPPPKVKSPILANVRKRSSTIFIRQFPWQ